MASPPRAARRALPGASQNELSRSKKTVVGRFSSSPSLAAERQFGVREFITALVCRGAAFVFSPHTAPRTGSCRINFNSQSRGTSYSGSAVNQSGNSRTQNKAQAPGTPGQRQTKAATTMPRTVPASHSKLPPGVQWQPRIHLQGVWTVVVLAQRKIHKLVHQQPATGRSAARRGSC